jgi:hypothetical protein
MARDEALEGLRRLVDGLSLGVGTPLAVPSTGSREVTLVMHDRGGRVLARIAVVVAARETFEHLARRIFNSTLRLEAYPMFVDEHTSEVLSGEINGQCLNVYPGTSSVFLRTAMGKVGSAPISLFHGRTQWGQVAFEGYVPSLIRGDLVLPILGTDGAKYTRSTSESITDDQLYWMIDLEVAFMPGALMSILDAQD